MAIVDLLVRVRADIGRATAGLMAVDNLSKKVETAMTRNMRSIRRAVNGVVASIVKFGAIMGIISLIVLAKAVSSFAKFEQAIVNAASVTGTLGEEFIRVKEHLSDLAQTLGKTTVFSAREAAEAMYDLASAGVDVANMTKEDMIPILDLAAATQSELKFSTETLTSTIAQFGLSIQDTERVSDVLTGTITSTKATIEKMSIALAYVGPIAHGTGLSLEETAGALGMLYNAGLPASMAGTALRGALLRLMNPTAAAKDTLESMGLTLQDIDPTLHKFADIVKILGERQMTTAESSIIFGVRAASGMVALSGAADKLEILTEKLHHVQGLTREIAEVQLSTLSGSFILLKSALEGLMISLGSMTNVGMKNFSSEVRDIVLAIEEPLMNALANLMNFLNQLGPTWESLKSVVSSVIGIIGDLAEIFGLAGEEGASRLANAINILAESVAGLMRWIDKHPGITKFVATLAVAVFIFINLVSVIVPVVTALAALKTAIIGIGTSMAFGLSLTSALTAAFPALGAAIGVLTGPIGWVILAITLLGAAYATNFWGMRDITNKVVNWVIDRFYDLVNGIGFVMWHIKKMMMNLWNDLVPMMKRLGMDVVKYQISAFQLLERKAKETSEVVQDEMEDMTVSIEKDLKDLSKELTIAQIDLEDYADTMNEFEAAPTRTGGEDIDEFFKARGGFISGEGEYIGKGHSDWEALAAKAAAPIDTTIYDKINRDSRLATNMRVGVEEQTLRTIKDSNLVQEEQNQKMDSLEHLQKLPEIVEKLDKLDLEIYNYTTNNYTSSSSSSRSSSSISITPSLVDTTKDSKSVSKVLRDYSNPFGF